MKSLLVLGLGSALIIAPVAQIQHGAIRPIPLATASAPTQASPWRLPSGSHIKIAGNFRRPTSDWSAGHRGVDFLVDGPLLAPHSGRLTFAGKVFGVPTVVLTHENTTTEVFEPACTTVEIDSEVAAGDEFAEYCTGGSKVDFHCLNSECIHWSFRLSDGQYVNPLRMVGLVGPARLYQALG